MIVKALRMVGCSVAPLHTVGGGVPDLLVGRDGQTYLIEIKNPNVPKRDKALKATQVEWHAAWRGSVPRRSRAKLLLPYHPPCR